MIRINLLPFRAARKRENIRRQVTISALIVVFSIVLMIYILVERNTKLSALKDNQNDKKVELAKFQKDLKEIKDLERQTKEIETKLNVIKDLEKGKTGPVRLLDELSQAVPRGQLFFKSLKERGGSLSLSGTAMDNETVALFMDNLKNSEHITSVELQGVTLRDLTRYRLRVSDFSLDCKTYAHAAKEAGKEAKQRTRKRR